MRVGNVNLTIHTLYDTGAQARGIKFSWEADQTTRLEDCIDFGKFEALTIIIIFNFCPRLSLHK